MSKNKKSYPLKAFIKDLGDVSVLNDTSFNDLYYWHFVDFAQPLKEEIIYNLSTLTKAKFDTYIRFVKDELDSTYYYDPDICIIEKWLKKFNLIESDFPFYSDKKVTQLLSYDKQNTSLELEEAKTARTIQLEFYWFAVFLEANKMIAFVNSFFLNDISESDDIETANKKEIELSPIFKSLEGFRSFNYLLEQFGIIDSSITKRGNQAKFNAIWGAPISKKIIFREHTELKEYVKFLNETYKLNYNSRSMSDGYKFHDSIKNWLNELSMQ